MKKRKNFSRIAESEESGIIMKKEIYLIDGTNQIFRSFFAIKSQLTSREGLPTNAIYGFTRMLKKLLSEKNPEYIAIAFDMAGPTFRHLEYEDYKANRPEAPDELIVQLPYIRKICTSYGIKVVEKEGYEADDIIGTIAEKAKQQGFSVVIVASDKDLYQLVDQKVTVLNVQKDNPNIGETEVQQIFGVMPTQVVDVFALWGDPTDNISGVPGIGEKSAKEIISRYGSLEIALERAEQLIDFMDLKEQIIILIEKIKKAKVKGKKTLFKECLSKCEEGKKLLEALIDLEKDPRFQGLFEGIASYFKAFIDKKPEFINKPEAATSLLIQLRKNLKGLEKGMSLKSWKSLVENRKSALLSRKLASIEKGVPIKIDMESFQYQGPDQKALKNIFIELGFSSLIDGEKEEPTKKLELISYQLVSEDNEVNGVFKEIEKKEKIVLSFWELPESSKKRYKSTLSFLLPSDEKAYVFLFPSNKALKNERTILEKLKSILEDGKVKKIGYDLKRIKNALQKKGINLQGLYFDVMIAFYLLDPSRKDFSFRTIIKEILKEKVSEVVLDEKEILSLNSDVLPQQCAQNAAYVARVYPNMRERLAKENLEELFEEIEIPLIDAISDMEMMGIKIDGTLLKSMSRKMEEEMKKVKKDIFHLTGEEFNINSPKQLGDVLFRKIGLKPSMKTPRSGDFATGMKILEELSKSHPLPKKILEYRAISKLKSTYVDALPPLINVKTARIHSSFHQTGTATGRLSSSEPNMQNIPVSGKYGRKIREAFIPAKGNLFLSADYSQIELRILAHLSDDPEMIEAFQKGEDIHRTTVSKILFIPYEKVSEQQRRFGKTINFGIIYGMSAFRLSKELGIARGEAQKFIDSYFKRFKGVKEYIDETTKFVEKHGYITTLFNRVRYFKEINSPNRMIVQQAIRQAVNTTIQGTAADLIKKTMIAIHQEMKEFSLKMILQVHDELLFEARKEEVEVLKPWIKDKMENIYKLKVPLFVHMGVGNNWAEAKPS